MATRGTISVLRNDGTVQFVYSHWDNYLYCNGRYLADVVTTYERAIDIVVADIASLEENRYLEDGEPATYYSSLRDYIENAPFEEYNYIFISNEWYLFDPDYGLDRVSELLE